MKLFVACVFLVVVVKSHKHENLSLLYEPSDRQLFDFGKEHPEPIGLWTLNAGNPVEVRDLNTVNTDQFNNQLLLDSMLHFDAERIPERVVHAKGSGAFGYFEVTHDVSKYTSADVFNGIGKRTPIAARFSTAIQDRGGSDFGRELKGLAVKFYTKEGNLDLLCLQTPVYFYRDPLFFWLLVHSFKRNPQTNLFDSTSAWDLLVKRPVFLHTFFFTQADYGIPDGYRKMDAFPIHTYELSNKNGETHYVRFNFRSEQGFSYITTEQAQQLQGQDPDYFLRDMFNAIAKGNYPGWKLEMDVMTPEDIQKVDFDPFDVSRLWMNGTYYTVQIGRLVLNRNPDNVFRDVEQAAYNPGNLVPGIPGPPDNLFRGRRLFYRDTQNYRVGRNHDLIMVNRPLYFKTFRRDGKPPVFTNGRNAPNTFTNSYNGAIPYVDEKRPWKKLLLIESTAIDLEPLNYFYNNLLNDEGHKQRFVNNLVLNLTPVTPPTLQRAFRILYLIDHELGRRVKLGVEAAQAQLLIQRTAQAAAPPPMNNLTRIPNWQGEPCDYHHDMKKY